MASMHRKNPLIPPLIDSFSPWKPTIPDAIKSQRGGSKIPLLASAGLPWHGPVSLLALIAGILRDITGIVPPHCTGIVPPHCTGIVPPHWLLLLLHHLQIRGNWRPLSVRALLLDHCEIWTKCFMILWRMMRRILTFTFCLINNSSNISL